MTIEDIDNRLTRLEERLAAAAAGRFVPIEVTRDDPLAGVELGVNIVMEDLNNEVTRATTSERNLVAKTEELQDKLEQITAQSELIRRQHQTILELSTPLLQLWDHVLALPIIGALDAVRAERVSSRLLNAIHTGDVRYVILDLTGLEIVDTGTAELLTRVIQAARLLGVRCAITGIQSDVAQTLVGLGVDLSQIHTHRNLKQGLVDCLRAMVADAAPEPEKPR